MGREIAGLTHLLDNAEQNIGNSTILLPQAGIYPTATIVPNTNPPRLLDLTGPSKRGQTTSIVFTAARVLQGADNPSPGFAGPITGIVEFGNGGRFTRVEVDVPVGPFLGVFEGASSALEPQDGGAIVTVPTGVLRAYVRYDNLYVQPILGLPPQSIAQRAGVAFVGPGGPHNTPIPGDPNFVTPAEPVLTKAMSAYFSRHFSRAYRTQYLYVGAPGVAGIALTAGPPYTGAVVTIPAHAKSVKVLRQPDTAAIDLAFYDGINQLETAAVAASTFPVIPISGTENIIRVFTNGASTVTFLALVYEIGI